MNNQIVRIYVDTNVLINYCTGQPNDVEALDYVFGKRRKEVLFTSSLAVVQTISSLQSKGRNNRKAYSREKTIEQLDKILPKFTILDLSYGDIKEGIQSLNKDIEDSVHYFVSQKMKCDAILTNNKRDFVYFNNVSLIDNNMVRLKQRVR
jgi:predicted nucleic acid-binding protein